ncbi:hypothetical protein JGI1_02243 [Candidatus Thermokryptus mobilis]|uniref:Uncharacterized protein n=1 Tax=Candidatus Thermokryptus mobilis TaxID=1643428 RepID=A0A0S4NF78_9BACT|nr:hypothetical protein [Candidatus Thermokryptus mobilis]CUU09059.1 hypothetical protein JGI1_02243 [Candidatus Thermokryptus mobilis]
MLKLDDIKKYDRSDMFSKIANFHKQIRDAVSIGEKFNPNFQLKKLTKSFSPDLVAQQ